MSDSDRIWSVVDRSWAAIDIYSGPEVFLATFAQGRRDLSLLYCAHFCQSEICNGGFRQFFHNSTGVLAPEAVEAFKAIGQPQIAAVVAQAMAELGLPYAREREPRQAALEPLAPDYFAHLEDLFLALIETENGGYDVAADKFLAGSSDENLT